MSITPVSRHERSIVANRAWQLPFAPTCVGGRLTVRWWLDQGRMRSVTDGVCAKLLTPPSSECVVGPVAESSTYRRPTPTCPQPLAMATPAVAQAEAEVGARATAARAKQRRRQLRHRVGNSLQLIYGMLSKQLADTADEGGRRGIKAIARRVCTLAQVYICSAPR
jgi:two-component sensor histidine kinase